MPYLKITFDLRVAEKPAGDILIACRSNAGFESFEESEENISAWIREDSYTEGMVEDSLKSLPREWDRHRAQDVLRNRTSRNHKTDDQRLSCRRHRSTENQRPGMRIIPEGRTQ